ncbi:hypothetical protein MBLNU457_1634t1 [Dothideomycetes sp. NU457]
METQDPFEWTISEVATFLRHVLPHQTSTIPNATFPDLDRLAQQFQDLQFPGYILLDHVTHDLLKDECKITNFAQRCSVISAIQILRTQSSRYQAIANGPAPASVTKFNLTPTQGTQSAETAVRPGEELIEDANGKKRRRLLLTPAVSAPSALESHTAAPINGNTVSEATASRDVIESSKKLPYLPQDSKARLDVDALIYGDTQLGERIPDDPSSSTSDDNDEFVVLNSRAKPAGLQTYVYTTMRHLMRSAETTTVKFKGRSMTALYPYHKKLTPVGAHQSMTVFDPESDETAIRIDESMVDKVDGHKKTVEPEGEWGFLLEKYKDDEVLPAYHASDNEVDSSLADELSDDERESIQGKPKILSAADVEGIVVNFINDVASDWRERKLPKLEEKKASRIWRRMKNSRTMRESLIGEAQDRQKHLETRLRKMRLDLETQEWSSKSALAKQCDILEPTIEDLEEQAWMISVYKRTSAPDTAHKQRSRTSKNHHAGEESMVSAATPNPGVEDFVSDDDFQDAAAFPSSDRIVPIEQAQPSVNTSPTNEPTENVTSEYIPDDDIVMVGSRPDSEKDGISDQHHNNDFVMHEDPPSDPEQIDGYDKLQARQELMKPNGDHDYRPSEDDDLPSPSIVLSQGLPKSSRQIGIKQDSPSPSRDTAKRKSEVIEISSDAEPTPKRRKPTTAQAPRTSDPYAATREDIDDWHPETLGRGGDRTRLLMALLHRMDLAKKLALWDYWQNHLHSNSETLTKELFSVRTQLLGKQNTPQLLPSEPLQNFFRLYACHYSCDAKAWNKQFARETLEGMEQHDMQYWAAMLSRAFPKIYRMRDDNAVIEISEGSSDEPVGKSDSPPKKRKRVVKTDATAKQARDVAQDRLAAFQEQSVKTPNGSFQFQSFQHDEDGAKNSVVVNVLRKDGDPLLSLHPKLATRFKPHQVEAVQFMWREITAVGESGGQGCLLAHTMGLGKTASSIGLLVSLKRALEREATRELVPADLRQLRVLITCPPALIPNWTKELREWSPSPTFFNLWGLGTGIVKKEQRFPIIEAWSKGKNSILLIGHQMLTRLVKAGKQDHNTEVSLDAVSGVARDSNVDRTTREEVMMRKMILESPTLVIADEAHAFRNRNAGVSAAVHEIRTQRRVALTGSPMSNNTGEIYTLISWIAPNYLGAADEFNSNFARPIEEGSYRDSTRYEKRKSLKKLELLKDEIAPKVHRADITALRGSLKTKTEYVLTVPLTEIQEKLYIKCVECLRPSGSDTEISQIKLFNWLSLLTLLCNHPRSFRTKLLERPVPKKPAQARESNGPSNADGDNTKDDEPEVVGEAHVSSIGMTPAMVEELVAEIPDSSSVELSCRMQLTRDILQLSKQAGDKVLIFSQSIPTLDYMQDMLKGIGVSYGRIDGSMRMVVRETTLSEYNAPGSTTQVLLISTRAGGQGLNIQTANRVIILDYGFNPTWEEQAVGRAYRLGQTKPVFVYRFVAAGTYENQLYNMGLFKMSLSQRVVDKKNPARNAERKASDWLYPPKQVDQKDISGEAGKDPLVLDRLIERQVKGEDGFIRAITTMETLQAEADDEPLTEEEKKEILEEKQARMREREVLGTLRATL